MTGPTQSTTDWRAVTRLHRQSRRFEPRYLASPAVGMADCSFVTGERSDGAAEAPPSASEAFVSIERSFNIHHQPATTPTMKNVDHADENIRSVELSFGIVELVREHRTATLAELTAETELAKSTVHAHLTTLTNLGFIVREGNHYRLGLRFLELGEEARNHRSEFRLIKEHVEALAERFDERAQFIVEENGEGVYIYRETGSHAVQTDSGVGRRINLHSTAAGKAILASVPEQRVREIIDHHGLESVTAHTITDEDELFEELATIRERGFSFNQEENLDGLNAVGVPVHDSTGAVLGALSVSGPSHRVKGERLEVEIPDLMLGMANEIELNLAYPR